MIQPYDVRMLVEGGDDGHAIKHFLKNRFNYSLEVNRGILVCHDSGQLLDRVETIQHDSGFNTIAIIADADSDPAIRWSAVRTRAGTDTNGAFFLPEQPHIEGTVAPWSKGRRVGVWLMPKPYAAGDLEAFFTEVRGQRSPQPALWDHALRAVKEIPEPHLFPRKDIGKAHLRTWLAWQKEPGASVGLALSQGAFDLEHPLALQFSRWLARLLEIPVETHAPGSAYPPP